MIKVELLSHSDLYLAYNAAKLCTGTNDIQVAVSFDKIKNFLKKKILSGDMMNPSHESVIEHLVYTFHIEGISRALLQEIVRHRIASFSVESTRFALKKILNSLDEQDLSDYLYLTGDSTIDSASNASLANVITLNEKGVKNDVLKYCLPEAFKTKLMFTLNARSLRNLFVLRTGKRALKEFRDLAYEIYRILPEEHKFLFEDRIHT